MNVTRVEDLWSASMLTGASYGTVYVVFPNVAIEWFGISKQTLASLSTVQLSLLCPFSSLLGELGLCLSIAYLRR